MEKIVVKKDETAELTEEEKAEEYVIESTMTEFECLMAQLNQSKLIQRALLYMIHQIPFTSQSTKSRVFQVFQTYPQPPMPVLKPLPLLLNDPVSYLPIFTLYELCVSVPYRIQYFFINELTGVSRSVQQSLMNYMEMYLTPSVLENPVEKANMRLKECDLMNVRVTSDATNVSVWDSIIEQYYASIISGVTEIKIIYSLSKMYPLNITTVRV